MINVQVNTLNYLVLGIIHPKLIHFPYATVSVEALVTFSDPDNPSGVSWRGKNSTQCQYNGNLWWPCTKTSNKNKNKKNITRLLW